MGMIKFTAPKRSRVLIFDPSGSEIIAKIVLGGIDHEILYSRYEVFYITPGILWRMLRNLRLFGRLGRGPEFSFKRFFDWVRWVPGTLYRVFLLSCIEHIDPEVVITFVDNSYPFQVISRVYDKATFIAVQNGARTYKCLNWLLPKPPEKGSVISMPHLACYGQYEVDQYRLYGHQIDHFHPIGSLPGGYFKTFLSPGTMVPEFDLCLIGESHWGSMNGESYLEIMRGVIALDKFLVRYVREENASLCIALRGDTGERDYYYGQYGDRAHFISRDNARMSSYDAVARSAVTVNWSSTLAREAFGWGAKVFSCNFIGDSHFDFPRAGFWSMIEPDYELFKKKLSFLRAMPQDEYFRQTREAAAYVMNNNIAQQPHVFLRKFVCDELAKRGRSFDRECYGNND